MMIFLEMFSCQIAFIYSAGTSIERSAGLAQRLRSGFLVILESELFSFFIIIITLLRIVITMQSVMSCLPPLSC